MTRMDKLKAKLFRSPPPKDFKWADLLSLTESLGIQHITDGGSHYKFIITSSYSEVISKPHPNGMLLLYQVKQAKNMITVKEESNG